MVMVPLTLIDDQSDKQTDTYDVMYDGVYRSCVRQITRERPGEVAPALNTTLRPGDEARPPGKLRERYGVVSSFGMDATEARTNIL